MSAGIEGVEVGAVASFFVALAVDDEEAAFGFVFEGLGDVKGPAADGEGQPEYGTVFGVDGGDHHAGRAASPGAGDVVAGEVGGVRGGFAEHGGVTAALGTLDQDLVGGLEMFGWGGVVSEGGRCGLAEGCLSGEREQ